MSQTTPTERTMPISGTLADWIREDQFRGYAYAYPHKSAYRQLDPPVDLRSAWADEDKNNLFLYVHLPFCEMRCGFCNLFTTVQPAQDFVAQTLDAITRQSQLWSELIQPQRVVQMGFGGGTPSYLEIDELKRLFNHIQNTWPVNFQSIPISFETSPATVDREKLQLLKDVGAKRISMGVQSFIEEDLKSIGRPQSQHQVDIAIENIKQQDFDVFNLDLIYGNTGQTHDHWIATVETALAHRPEEIFLYPLYVRELTGLGKHGYSPAEHRHQLFVAARDRLLDAGYCPVSMRHFRLETVQYTTDHQCQEDGMIGLGPGARSYTRQLHYSSDYAVGQGGVRKIISDFNLKSETELCHADYGVHLNLDEQKRRYVIRSLLQTDGLDISAYRKRFESTLDVDFPQLQQLLDLHLAERTAKTWRLNLDGLAYSDAIGPWLYSPAVNSRMESCVLQ